ncbi:ABC transporter permease [Nocardia speluncae]|uniref:ABC transporter permease n=1 Tax=Nocardia speluncae TaxID=419477 RepID=A0A846XE52_9NOCA|nr:ABC transporter permease [Nocardia speluncae]NKY33459.1 ABC transporter permease [Nocardia speluncae]
MTTPVTLAPPGRAAGRIRPPLRVLVCAGITLFFVVAALLPGVVATHSPWHTDLDNVLDAPSFSHLLGTDNAGRDLYSRIVWGTRESLSIGVGAIAVALAIAVVLGFAAGIGPRLVAEPVNRLLEILLAFPTLLLALLLVTLLGPSAQSLVIAVGVGTAPGYARLIRAQALGVKNSGYVESARALGHTGRTIFVQHIFPNALRPLLALFTLGIGQCVVWASGLSFLGLGVAPPSAEWGVLLNEGKSEVLTAWWLEVFPGIAIVLIALGVTQLGRFLQDRAEGRTDR